MKTLFKIGLTLSVAASVSMLDIIPAIGAAARVVTVAPGTRMPPNAAIVRPGPNIQKAIEARQTGIFRLAKYSLPNDGVAETYGVVEDGKIVDMVAKRDGKILPRTSTTGTRRYTEAQYARIFGFGVDLPLTSASRTAFLDITQARSAPAVSPTAGCPDDFAEMSPEMQRVAAQKPAYRNCRPLSWHDGGWQFSVARAFAEDAVLMFVEVNINNFFSMWTFEYIRGDHIALNIFGVKAIWSLTGG